MKEKTSPSVPSVKTAEEMLVRLLAALHEHHVLENATLLAAAVETVRFDMSFNQRERLFAAIKEITRNGKEILK